MFSGKILSISTGVHTCWPKCWEMTGMHGKAWVRLPKEGSSLGFTEWLMQGKRGGLSLLDSWASFAGLQTGSAGMQLVNLEDFPQTYGTEMSWFLFHFVYYSNFSKIKWRNLNRGLVHCQKCMPSREEICGDSSSTLRELPVQPGRTPLYLLFWVPHSARLLFGKCLCAALHLLCRIWADFYTGPTFNLSELTSPQLFHRRDRKNMRQVTLYLGYKKDRLMGTICYVKILIKQSAFSV